MWQFARDRRLGMEPLERRALLAGDVSVSVVNGNLIIDGDQLDNSISLAAGVEVGAFVVTGLDTVGGPTLLNGGAVPVEVSGVTGDILVHLKGGLDSFAAAGITTAGDMRIHTGQGNDAVSLEAGVIVNGKLSIQTGGGDDTVTATDVTVNGEADIKTGNGDDTVALTAVVVNEIDDEPENGAEVLGSFFGGRFGGNSGRGCNYHGYDDEGMDIDTSSGDDTLMINGLTAVKVRLRGGSGDDDFTLNGIVATKLDVDLSSGDDSLAVSASTVDRLMAKLGSGDDEMSIAADVAISTSLKLDGGPGFDDLVNDLPDNVPPDLIRRGFEMIS